MRWSKTYPITRAPLPDSPGIYQILLAKARGLAKTELGDLGDGAVLYVGGTKDSLSERVRQQTGQRTRALATLRRNLGAVLAKRLRLKPRPRRERPRVPLDYSNYSFEPKGDRRLTAWTETYLRIRWMECPSAAHVRKAEREWVGRLRPALNIQHNPKGPYRDLMKRLRAECSAKAKAWARRS